MIKVTIQPKSGQLLTRTVITLLASAIDFVEDLTAVHSDTEVESSHQHTG